MAMAMVNSARNWIRPEEEDGHERNLDGSSRVETDRGLTDSCLMMTVEKTLLSKQSLTDQIRDWPLYPSISSPNGVMWINLSRDRSKFTLNLEFYQNLR